MTPSQRARIFSEWRGYAEPHAKPDKQTCASDVIEKVMTALGLGARLRQEEVLGAWREIVGEFIASHASPQRLDRGVLIVQVLQPTMHYELDRVWKPKILEKYRERFGKKVIKEIKFRIG